ncbi:hypothetical protein OL548_16730 [Lysinibacillus sp. MHQ-1]|nr:hypothetical protein OL548_16730 [Lysinibacillus sp. MHQ-1]
MIYKTKKLEKKAFEEGHATGAIHMDLEQQLSDMDSQDGRHPMPNKEKIDICISRIRLTL